jgi:PTS system mannose-specific IIC component
MTTTWSEILLAGIFGGLLAIERRAFLQAMVSRPLVSATLMGLLLGDPASGIYVGLVLELFHLGGVNLGAALPENDTVVATGCAAAAAAMARASGGGGTPAIWTLSLLLFAGLAKVGQKLDRQFESYTARLARKALASAEAGELARAVRQNLWGMWPIFAIDGCITAGCAAAGAALGRHLAAFPLDWLRGLAWAYPALASVAAAIAVRGSHARRAPLYAVAAATVVTLAAAAIELGRAM